MKMGKGIKGKFVEIRNLPQSVLLRNKNSASFFWIPLLFTMIGGEIAREMNDESIGPLRHFEGEEKSKSYTTPQIIAKMKNDFSRLCGEKSFAIFACLREIKSLLQTPSGNIFHCFISLFVWPTKLKFDKCFTTRNEFINNRLDGIHVSYLKWDNSRLSSGQWKGKSTEFPWRLIKVMEALRRRKVVPRIPRELKGISLRDYDEMNARQLIKKLSDETLSAGACKTASSQNEKLRIQTMPNELWGCKSWLHEANNIHLVRCSVN